MVLLSFLETGKILVFESLHKKDPLGTFIRERCRVRTDIVFRIGVFWFVLVGLVGIPLRVVFRVLPSI